MHKILLESLKQINENKLITKNALPAFSLYTLYLSSKFTLKVVSLQK